MRPVCASFSTLPYCIFNLLRPRPYLIQVVNWTEAPRLPFPREQFLISWAILVPEASLNRHLADDAIIEGLFGEPRPYCGFFLFTLLQL